jgi:hypothetical protein
VSASSSVLTVADVRFSKLTQLLGRFGLSLRLLEDDEPITGSFWGDSEAGIVKRCVYVRLDTPVHSLLHEACHVICMDEARRAGLDRDAGGDDIEEAAVCYLQILLADYLPGVGRDRLMQDMDAWGYSFRLGSSRAWFESDAADARAWLLDRALLIDTGTPTFELRK